MDIGELFVSLGIKGSDKTLSDLLSAKEGLKDAGEEARTLNDILSKLGLKSSSPTTFGGLIGMADDFEASAAAARDAKDALDDLAEPVPDDQITILADMREQLGQIAEASRTAKVEVGKIQPKDPEKTKQHFDGVKKSLKDISALSFEAKAAILGAAYALGQMVTQSGQRGTDLSNFNAVLGVSAQTLQRYQFAARQVGVSNQDVEASFKALQTTMTKTLMGEGAPKGLARMAQLTGNLTPEDLKRFAEQPQLLLQKLQEYAAKETNVGLRNEVLKSFGMNEGMIAALQRQAFRPDVLAKAPTYSDGEVKALDSANVAWANLGNKVEMAFGHFNAAHGGELVKEFGQLTDKVLALANAFMKLADAIKLFELVGKIFEGWKVIFEGITKYVTLQLGVINAVGDAAKGKPSATKAIQDETLQFFMSDLPNVFKEIAGEVFGAADTAGKKLPPHAVAPKPAPPGASAPSPAMPPAPSAPGQRSPGAVGGKPGASAPGVGAGSVAAVGGITPEVIQKMAALAGSGKTAAPELRLVVPPSPIMPTPKAALPPVPASSAQGGPAQTIDVKQTLNFNHDGKDAKRTSDSTKAAVQAAFRQMAAQAQGT